MRRVAPAGPSSLAARRALPVLIAFAAGADLGVSETDDRAGGVIDTAPVLAAGATDKYGPALCPKIPMRAGAEDEVAIGVVGGDSVGVEPGAVTAAAVIAAEDTAAGDDMSLWAAGPEVGTNPDADGVLLAYGADVAVLTGVAL